ncbi:hypothetical protein GCM10023314_01310 [Algibacter agarivorans]|uniref:Uncharacterized protein n=1 Tax=Algibacter agarivorans TaxID=1109741 RepID=A0ABP9GBR4_9FLAO
MRIQSVFYSINFLAFAKKTYKNVHDFLKKLNHFKPEIFTGGIDINFGSKLSKLDQQASLKKH